MSEPMCRTRGQDRKKSKSAINIIDYFFHNNRKYCCHANIFAVVLLCKSVFQKLYFLTVSHLKTPLFRVFPRYIRVPCKYICTISKFRVQIYLTFRTHFPGFIPLSFEKTDSLSSIFLLLIRFHCKSHPFFFALCTICTLCLCASCTNSHLFPEDFPFLRKNWHGVCFISGQNTIDAEVQEEGASSGQALRIKS